LLSIQYMVALSLYLAFLQVAVYKWDNKSCIQRERERAEPRKLINKLLLASKNGKLYEKPKADGTAVINIAQ